LQGIGCDEVFACLYVPGGGAYRLRIHPYDFNDEYKGICSSELYGMVLIFNGKYY
jgi:hypothetical protein